MPEVYKKYIKEYFDEDGNLKDISIDYKQNFNFSYDILDEIAIYNPDDLAVVWCDDFGNEKKITFKQMSDISNRVANFFIHHGIKYGDFVLLILKKNFQYWYILNALHKIGAIAIPASHMLSVLDIKYRLDFADIKYIVFTDKAGVHDRVLDATSCYKNSKGLFCVGEDIPGSINIFKNIENYSKYLKRVETNVKDTMICYFTSGTTGSPKLVQHNYYNTLHLFLLKRNPIFLVVHSHLYMQYLYL